MGRPLKRQTIVDMDLVASGKKLGKQVGYNKYLVQKTAKEDSEEIVMLSTEEDLENGYVVLKIDGKVVTKILRNIIQTEDGIIEYITNEDGKMVINGEVVKPEEPKEPEESEEGEPVAQAEEPVVQTTVKKSSKKATVTE